MKKKNLTFKQKSALRYILYNGPCEARNPSDRLVMEAMARRGLIVRDGDKFDLREESKVLIQRMIDEKRLGLR